MIAGAKIRATNTADTGQPKGGIAVKQVFFRSIGAVLAGFFAVVIAHLGTDVVLHATGVFPPWGQPMSDALFLLATDYRTVFSVAGS